MLKKLLITLLALVGMASVASAQLVYSTPSPLQQTSQDVYIYFNAAMGNQGLMDLPATTKVYAHTGVITDKSKNSSDWKYTITQWNENTDKNTLERVSDNLYRLKVGNINEFYGVPEGEVVEQIAFVFRDANGSKQGKTSTGSDIFLDVVPEGLQVFLTCDIDNSALFGAQEVNFKVAVTEKANISLYLNNELIANEQNATELTYAFTFNAAGNYRFKAIAVAGENEVESTELRFTYQDPSPQADYPGGVPKMGAVRNEDGSVTFCLCAPNKEIVQLVGSWDNYQPKSTSTMNYQDYNDFRYFWLTVPDLAADQQYFYYYLVNMDTPVGDPYAKLTLESSDSSISSSVFPNLPKFPSNVNSKIKLSVYQENINDYDWKCTDFVAPEKKDLVIYELLLRDFTGTEGKARGNGTVRQAIEKLPYLFELGVNVIELLPIMEFNGHNSWGYNTNFYFAPDKAYGTPDDYKEFIDICHQNGVAVVLDIVFNQADYHPWYAMYSPGNNPFFNATAPHAFSVLNDWNQGNPVVQQMFRDCVQYWLREYHVDGYRFDLVKGLGDNDSYKNNSADATGAYNASRVARMKELQDAMHEVNPKAYVINENLAGAKEENEMAAFGQLNWANVNESGRQFAMGYKSNSTLRRMYAKFDSRDINSTVAYLESHDEQRLGYEQIKYGVDDIKNNPAEAKRRLGATAAQMILVPGAHMIWQFSERGNSQNTKNKDWGNIVDPKIVDWDSMEDINVLALYNAYKGLIDIRLSNPELFDVNNGAEFTMNCASSNWDKGRTIYSSLGDKELITVINPLTSGEPVEIATKFKQADSSKYEILLRPMGTAPTFSAENGTATVAPNSFVVIGTKDVISGVEEVAAEAEAAQALVFAAQGNIYVAADYDTLDIWNLAGAHVASKKSVKAGEGVGVAPGIYVVKVDGATAKVLVR